jgi:hypothetical protein
MRLTRFGGKIMYFRFYSLEIMPIELQMATVIEVDNELERI